MVSEWWHSQTFERTPRTLIEILSIHRNHVLTENLTDHAVQSCLGRRVGQEHDRGVMSLQQTQRVGVEMIVRDLRNRNTRLIRKIDERHAHLTTLSTHTHTRDVCLGLCLGL